MKPRLWYRHRKHEFRLWQRYFLYYTFPRCLACGKRKGNWRHWGLPDHGRIYPC